MDEAEIERMVQDAAKYATEDKQKKERIETKNNADSLVFQTEKFVDEYKDKLGADKEGLEAMAKELMEMIEKDDFDQEAVNTKTEELSKKLQEIGGKMYEQASGKPGGEGAAEESGEKKDDQPENAEEGEVVDEDKKDK
jgi:molecular chaperone DnaK